MSSSYRSPQGTVAARIQVFQNVQTLENQARKFNRVPKALSQPQDSGVTIGRGRREDSSFGSPAGRASRDGPDGSRGDGRPPVGSFQPKLHPSMKEKEVYTRPTTRSASRPITAKINNPANLARPEPSYLSDEQIGIVLKHPRSHSSENIANAASEASTARSRLRPIAKNEELKDVGHRGRAYTLVELGNMIDNAIEDHACDVSSIPSTEASDGIVPQSTIIARWSSVRASRSSREQACDATDRARSRSQCAQLAREQAETRGSIDQSRIYKTDQQDERQHQPKSAEPETSTGTESLSRPTRITSIPDSSPVKQRAAIFEKLEQQPVVADQACEAPHHHHIHVKQEWSVIPVHVPTKQVEKKMHHFKFGRTIQSRPESPLVTLTLPQLVSPRPRSRRTSFTSSRDTQETYKTARQSEDHESAESFAESFQYDHKDSLRRSSKNWPRKWNLFTKGTTIPPQETERVVSAEPKDDHYPHARPSVVKSRVQDLLAAARERDETEACRRRSEMDQLSRRQIRGSGHFTEREIRKTNEDANSLVPTEIPSFQAPVGNETEVLAKTFNQIDIEQNESDEKIPTEHEESTPKTPLRHSIEKEALKAPGSPLLPDEFRAGSPVKAGPSTPDRGRSLTAAPTISRGRSHYRIEQRFTLSPEPSRSPSRASRGRMKVEVEVRESPEREARERGDKIVIIRANIDATDGSGEGGE